MKKIMLIDDAPEIRLIAEHLRGKNIEILCGSSLDDANEYVYDEHIEFDLIIIDFSLGYYVFTEDKYQEEFESLGNNKQDLIGWVWIKEFLDKQKGYNPKNIIGLSAYIDLLDPYAINSLGIRVVDKGMKDSRLLFCELVNNIE